VITAGVAVVVKCSLIPDPKDRTRESGCLRTELIPLLTTNPRTNTSSQPPHKRKHPIQPTTMPITIPIMVEDGSIDIMNVFISTCPPIFIIFYSNFW
jgi:hypothetical protein